MSKQTKDYSVYLEFLKIKSKQEGICQKLYKRELEKEILKSTLKEIEEEILGLECDCYGEMRGGFELCRNRIDEIINKYI